MAAALGSHRSSLKGGDSSSRDGGSGVQFADAAPLTLDTNAPYGCEVDCDTDPLASDSEGQATPKPKATRSASVNASAREPAAEAQATKSPKSPKKSSSRERLLHDCVASLKLLLVIFVFLPVVTLLLIIICGAILAGIEGWSFKEGFFYMGTVMACSLTGLSTRVPSTQGGRVWVIISSAWGLGFFGAGVSLMATPIVAPLVRLLHLHQSPVV